MSPPADALAHLESVAPEYGATLISADGEHRAALTITLPSGVQHVFDLTLSFAGNKVSACERQVGSKLPNFCPDRHINSDGSFCLGWGENNPNTIDGVDAARTWWSALGRYLAHQVSAAKSRRWPGRQNDRAHGDAAKYQAEAEAAADRLGVAFTECAKANEYSARLDDRPGHSRLELWQGGKRLARVSIRAQQLVGEHTICPCNSAARVAITDCGNHAKDLVDFAVALFLWKEKEREFMQELASQGVECCGTLSSCGLRDAKAALRKKPKQKEKPHARRSKYYRAPVKPKRPR